jgi:hypothetical protein
MMACDIKLGEWSRQLRFSLGSQVSSDSLLCKQVRDLFFDVIHPFSVAFENFNLQPDWQRRMATISNSLSDFE